MNSMWIQAIGGYLVNLAHARRIYVHEQHSKSLVLIDLGYNKASDYDQTSGDLVLMDGTKEECNSFIEGLEEWMRYKGALVYKGHEE